MSELTAAHISILFFFSDKALLHSHYSSHSLIPVLIVENFLEMLTRAQSSRIDDQRGVGIDVGDLPEFLKSSSSDQQSEISDGSSVSPLHSSKATRTVSATEANITSE